MALVCLASFQDSRQRPRKATTTAKTYQMNVPDTVTSIRPANANRTYLTLRNESLGVDMRYAYSAADLPGNGFLVRFGEAVDIESPQEIFAISTIAGQIIPISMDEGSG